MAAYAASTTRPNILLIMTDQQSHNSWSGAGNPWLKTPAMDSLAASGTTFQQAHCTYPVCSPSRSSIFTSRMPHETEVMENSRPIRDQNTLVAVVSDHGEGLGVHRWVQKAAFWEEVVRVPMILRGPGIRAGHVNRDLASLLDLLPTFCDYSGIDAPKGLRGRTLRAALDGGHVSRPFVVSELRYGAAGRQGRMLRSRRYKYVKWNSGTRNEQLFDLETDPGEVRNLVSEPDASESLKQHRELLRHWCTENNDSFPAVS
jgi:arylsulfatase A-like enzyme